MKKAAFNSSPSKSKGQVILEYLLLSLCLCVIALRTMITESVAVQSTALLANLGSSVNSLLLSGVLVLSFVIWLVWAFCSKRFIYRFTGIEIGLYIFCIAAIVAGFAAANKRAAITNIIIILAPILMVILLVQILDKQSKIKLLLCVVAALGFVSSYQCAEQFFFSNQMTIEQYLRDPQAVLGPLGIQLGSFQQFLFEHRLYTKGVRGFFTTSNSAGSFALLASFAAICLLVEKFKNRKSGEFGFLWPAICGIAVAVVIFGLAITKSKGAIAASLIAAVMFIAYLLFGSWLKAHKREIFTVCLLLFIAGSCAVVWYGITNARLPGGNSMLVRWQYWHASALMYADYPFTGVGPGNFGSFYTHYKSPSALETVADPHNFLLSILTQYGPIGLVGFLALVSVPLWRAVSRKPDSASHKTNASEPMFRRLAIAFVIVISTALLLIRPIISPLPSIGSHEEITAAVIVLYVMPMIIFIIGFILLALPLRSEHAVQSRNLYVKNKLRMTNIIIAALFCAVLGVALHNMIDFAIFEPAVFTTFCAIIACLIALDFHRKSRPQFVLNPTLLMRVLIVVGGLLIIWAYFSYALVPVAKADAKIKIAMQNFGYAHKLLDEAAKDDPMDQAALYLNGRLYLQHYNQMKEKQPTILKRAEECFLNAIDRNKADFKNYEKLGMVYNLLNRTQDAYDWSLKAVKHYPGSARLRLNLAQIAEQLGETDLAVKHYKEAVDIEDKYRRQFQEMYSGWKLISRLGQEKYKFAKERIKSLSQQSSP